MQRLQLCELARVRAARELPPAAAAVLAGEYERANLVAVALGALQEEEPKEQFDDGRRR